MDVPSAGVHENFQMYRTPESLHRWYKCSLTDLYPGVFIDSRLPTAGNLGDGQVLVLIRFHALSVSSNMFSMVPEVGERYLIVLHR